MRPEQTEPEEREFPKEPHLIQRLFRRLTREGPVRACYEAGVSGYDLSRQITACGVPCQVIAPALTPRRPGERIKTNRRDAKKLVRLFRAGELTAIHVPDETEEAVRDLLRCRDAVRRDVLLWRHRVVKFLDRHGRLFVAGKNWSHRHWARIRSQRFEVPALQRTFEATQFALEQALAHLAELDKEIGSRRARTGGLHLSGNDPAGTSGGVTSRIGNVTRGSRMGFNFLSGVGRAPMWARLESPRAHYATLGPRTETTRANRRRHLPTNHGHAALPIRVTRAYQSDSSSKPPHRMRAVNALRNRFAQSGTGPDP